MGGAGFIVMFFAFEGKMKQRISTPIPLTIVAFAKNIKRQNLSPLLHAIPNKNFNIKFKRLLLKTVKFSFHSIQLKLRNPFKEIVKLRI